MANWSDISFAATQTDYIARLELLRTRSQAVATEVENARGGQADLITRIQQCMVMSVGFTQDVNANNNRIRNVPTAIYNDEAINKAYGDAIKAYADGLAFAAALPAQAGGYGLGISTDGTTAAWGLSVPDAIAILNSFGYFNS